MAQSDIVKSKVQASPIQKVTVDNASVAPSTLSLSSLPLPVKITDGTHDVAESNSAPAGTEYALIVRNIPSGVQAVSNATAANLKVDISGTGANATALKVDNSAVTQPVSGVVSTKTSLTASAPAAATVGVASGSAVALNATRKGLVLINTSANYISLGLGTTAVLYSGITLNPGGGTFVMDEYTFFTGAIYAIASAAASNLAVQELTT